MEEGQGNTYLLDDGLRECLAHGDVLTGCNSAATRLPVGSGQWGWRRGGCLGKLGRRAGSERPS